MTGYGTRFPPPQMTILLADYRFCEYRLRILERHPRANRASITAVLSRMARLAAECPEVQFRA